MTFVDMCQDGQSDRASALAKGDIFTRSVSFAFYSWYILLTIVFCISYCIEIVKRGRFFLLFLERDLIDLSLWQVNC